ncbi:MAG TPA: 2OG-Fe(II) oxygenase, partial [Dongiaceae bacterium]
MVPFRLTPGDPAPWFVAPSPRNPRYHFDLVAGRYITLCFYGSAANPAVGQMLSAIRAAVDVFQDDHASFFGVSADPEDERQMRIQERIPGFRLLWDYNLKIAARYGICAEPEPGGTARYQPASFILDPALRVLAVLPIADPAAHVRQLLETVGRLPPLGSRQPGRPAAPVLLVPHLFERDLCGELIAAYDRHGGEDSGYMTSDAQGRTVGVVDYGRKRRRDYLVEDATLRQAIRDRMQRRLVPELRKAFQFSAGFIERYIVACYDAGEGGYFRPHRDNTTKGTVHRKFAVTINLNAEDYEGGDLCFPEFGRDTYRAPSGGAIVFSCSLMHEALPVTRGRRYCVLPFLYDGAGARVREANLDYLVEDKRRDEIEMSGATASVVDQQGLNREQDLQALGRTMGAAAHDLNNLLMVAMGNAEMLTAKLAGDARLLEMAELISKSAKRSAGLTGRLLALARQQPLQPQAVDINRLLANLEDRLRSALGETIHIELIRGAELWPASADVAALEAVILNLALDAGDAMPDGGRLSISTANLRIGKAEAERYAPLQPGQYVTISLAGLSPDRAG